MGKYDKLDRLVSEYVRKRDSDKNGMITCICCGKKVHWKESDAAHFIPRQHISTRFNGKNINACCVSCNRYLDGNLDKYSIGLILKWGITTSVELNYLKTQTLKLSLSDIKEIEQQMREKIKQLEHERNNSRKKL